MWSRCYVGKVWLIIFMSCHLKSGPFLVQNTVLTSMFTFKHYNYTINHCNMILKGI